MEELQQSVEIAYYQLCTAAKKCKVDEEITTALGEIEINDIKYQIHLSLVSDERVWLGPDDIATYNFNNQ